MLLVQSRSRRQRWRAPLLIAPLVLALASEVLGSEVLGSEILAEAEIKEPPFAASATEKHGHWLGGEPPINKNQSRINTYYRITPLATPNQLSVVLRFENIVSDDAEVEILAIDGAKIISPGKFTRWRLPKSTASELTLIVSVPDDKASYLSLTTRQWGKGAARAILLESIMDHYKKSSQ